MLATFVIEIILLLIVVAKYSLRTARTRLIATMLLFLAIFQLAEYNVCGGMGLHAAQWSRLGFIAITTLPPIGLHLALAIRGKQKEWNKLKLAAYGTGLVWIVIFGFSNWAFSSYECAGNYAIFQMRSPFDTYYLLFYALWLSLTIMLSLFFMHEVGKVRRRALELLVIGYLLFIFPTMIVMSLDRATIDGLPSIMCGFAIIFALILAFGIAPLEKRIATEKLPKRHVQKRRIKKPVL